MEFRFSEEQELLRNAVAEFAAAEIAPVAREISEQDRFPDGIFRKLGELGMLGVFVPQAYGGAGLGNTERAIVLEEISRYSAGLGIAVMTHQLGGAVILNHGTEDQKTRYLPDLARGARIGALAVTEPGGGSDPATHQTAAVKEDATGSWVINGRKCFITNSAIADVHIVTAKTGQDEKGRAKISAFLVEKGNPGLRAVRTEDKVGLRGSVTGDVQLADCRVGPEALVGPEGAGLKTALATIGEVGRPGMAAIATGIIRACLDEAVRFAKNRSMYGQPIAKLQAIQFHIADIKTDYEAARLLLYRATSLKDAGVPCAAEMAIAKYFATEASVRAAQRAMAVMGGYGTIHDYPVGRYLGDAMTTIPSGGTSEIMKLIIAASALA